VQTFSISLPEAAYGDAAQRSTFVNELLAAAARRPDVASAAAVSGLPLTNFRYGISMSTRDGVRLSDDEQDRLAVQVRVVTPAYFRTMAIPVVRGRAFTDADRLGSEPAIILNQAAAERTWPGADAIGHALTIGTRLGQGAGPAGGIVVGIAGDVRDHGPSAAVRPTLYLAHAQFPIDAMSVVVRARGGPAALVEPMRAALADLDPDVPMFRVRTMEQIAANAVAQPRLYMVLIACFAGTAMLLAAIGLYGVLAYAVGQRTREIGIRLALGANRGDVLRMVMGQAGRLALAGIGLGLAAAGLASGVLRSQLFEIAPTDAATYVAVAVILFAVSLVASWIPARRASQVDPLRALKHD
jgi:putative ABC transport system permease protein